ncbi:hypothetical protein COU76_05690 [Candidatus Peregrinibacteria bacterium CG10_big_fil_rev_8_21_14_0_10_49_10]|nr:MAG: hypothetical protein COU76_05690 [Candidatus Peregrinibacteria bacterium CG10_big_fil_rev_8_21_14_0_10_49_10]
MGVVEPDQKYAPVVFVTVGREGQGALPKKHPWKLSAFDVELVPKHLCCPYRINLTRGLSHRA